MNYEPNDSPFGDAYREYLAVGARSLRAVPTGTLAEFVSVADSKTNTPAYADDSALAHFKDDLNNELYERTEDY
jgi:hypothetical protein